MRGIRLFDLMDTMRDFDSTLEMVKKKVDEAYMKYKNGDVTGAIMILKELPADVGHLNMLIKNMRW